MKIIHNKKDPITKDSICGLGNFDGIHIGHQKIIKRIISLAGERKSAGIVTFLPPPVSTLKPNNIFFLTTKIEKEKILSLLGIDFIFYFNFDEIFAKKTPEEFVDLLDNLLRPSTVIVGENFHFGRNRIGTAQRLKEISKERFSVEIMPIIKEAGVEVSSTRVRELLLLGNIPTANRILGREYIITGRVIKGKGKGAKLGFPTINLSVDKEKLLPLAGVYEVKLDIRDKNYKGAMYLTAEAIEVHIIDFSGNIYNEEVTVKLLRRLRGIKKFPDDASLKEAIAKDLEKVL